MFVDIGVYLTINYSSSRSFGFFLEKCSHWRHFLVSSTPNMELMPISRMWHDGITKHSKNTYTDNNRSSAHRGQKIFIPQRRLHQVTLTWPEFLVYSCPSDSVLYAFRGIEFSRPPSTCLFFDGLSLCNLKLQVALYRNLLPNILHSVVTENSNSTRYTLSALWSLNRHPYPTLTGIGLAKWKTRKKGTTIAQFNNNLVTFGKRVPSIYN